MEVSCDQQHVKASGNVLCTYCATAIILSPRLLDVFLKYNYRSREGIIGAILILRVARQCRVSSVLGSLTVVLTSVLYGALQVDFGVWNSVTFL